MPDHHSACPLCNAGHFERSQLYAAHHLVQCRACGFWFSHRVPTDAELLAFYGNYTMIRDLSPVTRIRYVELLDRFEAYRSTGVLCDVGAGGGLFLDQAKAAGWQCRGTEFDQAIVEECRARGIDMHCGPLLDHTWPKGSVDVVVSIEVIEHLRWPQQDLRAMVDLLRPGGALYLTTPNFNSISKWLNRGTWNVVNYPEHISFFTPATLHRALAGLGLRRVSLRTTGLSITRLKRSHGGTGQAASGLSSDEQLRRTIEGKPWLRVAKKAADGLLDLTGTGDSLKALYVKPVQ
ncbi:MAG: class I SAM-dependent methyltransferase [Flavobacteriales bacterium]|nr:MAG: class I SAM-dependent methyltransferase [Flavobacteriales bacterium]